MICLDILGPVVDFEKELNHLQEEIDLLQEKKDRWLLLQEERRSEAVEKILVTRTEGARG